MTIYEYNENWKLKTVTENIYSLHLYKTCKAKKKKCYGNIF